MDFDYKYKIIKNWSELHTLVAYCKQTKNASTDFESSGNDAMHPGSFPTILGVSFQPGGGWVIPLAHKDSPFRENGEWVMVLQYFGREIIENPAITKIGQNIKYEMNWWQKYGISMVGPVFDTMLAKYLLDEERPHGLKPMVSRWLPEFDGYDLPGKPGDKATSEQLTTFWSNVPLETLSKYCALDSDLTFRIYLYLEPRLIELGFYPLFRNMLMMASRVLASAQFEGMLVDRDYLYELKNTYQLKIVECEKKLRSIPKIIQYEKAKLTEIKEEMVSTLEDEIAELKKTRGNERLIANRETKINEYLAGVYNTKKDRERIEPLNFNSTKQMIDLLFVSEHGFELPIIRYTVDIHKRETDTPSTDEATLKELESRDRSKFITTLLELRGLVKINSTYVVGMWEKLNSNDRIHGSFLLHGTVTGRLSSRNPNLQNIPREATSADIKRMFIAPKGKVIMQLDYSQAELRVLASQAKEKTMIEWFNTGRDVHLASACLKWGEEYDNIYPIYKDESHPEYHKWLVRRKQAKTINFGIVYGQTAKKLSATLSSDEHIVTIDEAQEFLDNFNNQFPKIARFIIRQGKIAKRDGYVVSLFGRKRRLPKVDSNNWGEKAEALRQAVNAPIQGAASDYALFSSILIRENIKMGNLPTSLVQIGTVHDSIIFYADPTTLHDIIPKLGYICKNPQTKTWFNFEVNTLEMKVDFEVGTNWANLKRYNPQEDYSKQVT